MHLVTGVHVNVHHFETLNMRQVVLTTRLPFKNVTWNDQDMGYYTHGAPRLPPKTDTQTLNPSAQVVP